MISGSIPKRYARALMALAREKRSDLEALSRELSIFAGQITPGSSLQSFLANKLVAASRKEKVLSGLLAKSSPSPILSNFLRLLQKRDRLLFLPEIRAEFRRLADEQEGIVRGEVLAATDLPESVAGALREKLGAILSKKVILAIHKDPSIIGGLVVKVGSLSMDGSIRGQLDSIRDKFSERVNF